MLPSWLRAVAPRLGPRQGAGSPLRRFSTQINPLLGVPLSSKLPPPPVLPTPHGTHVGPQHPNVAVAHFRQVAVSPKKLRVVANMVPGLFVREAMLQMEFCRKNIAVVVKNAIDSAVSNAKVQYGWDVNRLIVGALYYQIKHPSAPSCRRASSPFPDLPPSTPPSSPPLVLVAE